MRVRVKAKLPDLGNPQSAPLADYPLKPSSFFLSMSVHSLIVVSILAIKIAPESGQRPIYDELIKPKKTKIVYYDFRRKVPEVIPSAKPSASVKPRGQELSKQAIIASSPKPKSSQVFISTPVPKIEVQRDLPLPTMIAKLDSIPPIPTVMPPKKQFVPPRPAKEESKLPLKIPILEASAAPPSSTVTQLVPLPASSISAIPTIPRKAPESVEPQTGNAKADIAVASLHPPENARAAMPEGARPAQFSKAPTQGEAASGGGDKTAALTVPDLTIRNPKPDAPPAAATEPVLYKERVRGIPISTLSVPLRPSSRMIPAAVDARFKGRNVYTIVIPMERIPAYSGDWIVWFSDRSSKAGETPVVRAPVPYRKMELVKQAPPNARTKERIQFAATLGRNGKLAVITLLTKINAALETAVLADLGAWEFQPATSDGVAIDIDVVVEIPFNLPTLAPGDPVAAN